MVSGLLWLYSKEKSRFGFSALVKVKLEVDLTDGGAGRGAVAMDIHGMHSVNDYFSESIT